MKSNLALLTLLFLNLSGCSMNHAEDKTNVKESMYFGEQPPGLVPKIFEPKIVSPNGEFESGTFTPDMQSFYFTKAIGEDKKRGFFVIHKENNQWGKASETDLHWPQFSYDGNKMFIGKMYREREGGGWSEPKSPGAFIEHMAHGRSVSASGTYYFTGYKKRGVVGALYYSRLINGQYEEPIKLRDDMNQGEYIAGSMIAPDESYLIWSVQRAEGFGQSDLYISFKEQDGTWSNVVNMGTAINTEKQESSPQFSPDGKYFFFIRGAWHVNGSGKRVYEGKQYWVDIQLIKNLKLKSEFT
ncbi:PD40 domain-containing protein [Pseudoalteromonas piscicida]|uniref:PD40 domain-containing protein n=1 Tax=Pseudoalteromonas piscicida TaxID=43662 RepID=UPI0005FA16F7|nr:PD40 domain-containing protein [Pseudoalteromonas piscicida]KJZ02692.1 hypothetical protein TW73_11585 [Pseudoalteromonas piscicida]